MSVWSAFLCKSYFKCDDCMHMAMKITHDAIECLKPTVDGFENWTEKTNVRKVCFILILKILA